MAHIGSAALIVMGAVNILWGLVAIAALYLVIRVSGKIAPALDRVETSIPPAMRKAHEILEKVSRIADTVNNKADRVHGALVRVDETTARMADSAERAGAAVNRRLIAVKAFAFAIRTGAHVLAQEFSRQRHERRATAMQPVQPRPIPSENRRAA